MKKQARVMQEQMQQMRSSLQTTLFEGSAGNGLVKITLNGEKELKKIEIQPETLSDAEGLQDLIIAAHNEAAQKADAEQPTNNMPFFS